MTSFFVAKIYSIRMRLPYLTYNQTKQQKVVSTFMGLDQKLVGQDGEFADMKNISDRHYPALSNRRPRGEIIETLAKPNGLYWKNGLFYVDGTDCYYRGEKVADLSVTDSKKKIVGMGAYIVIFPDKVVFNTNDNSISRIEAEYKSTGTVTFAPLSWNSVFTKISATNIDKIFKKGDAVFISGCTNEAFNVSKVITDIGSGYIVVTEKIDAQFTQTAQLTIKRKSPDLDFVCEHSNRLWGCNSETHEIYASKLGDPLNWNNFEGISTDSYALTVGSDGDFTGCISHLGYVLFFKENAIHMMYGDKPSNYSLNTKVMPGVAVGNEESLQVVNETLFYGGRNAFYSFDGSFPTNVSQNITESFTEAHASQCNGKYYVSCKLNGKQTILVYDPAYGLWDKENEEEFLFSAYGEGKLYYIDKNKILKTIEGESKEIVEWMAESVDLTESMLTEKHISKFMFNLWLAKGSEVEVYLRYEDEPMWCRKGIIHSTKNTTYTLNVIPHRCNKYRWKIEGKGEFKLLGMSRQTEGGSEINGSVQFGFRK